MKDTMFVRAEEIVKDLDVSESYAYKLIRKLNAELKEKGFITIPGRVSRRFYRERMYAPEKEPETHSQSVRQEMIR